MNKKRAARRRQQWFAIGIAVFLIGTFLITLLAPGGNTHLFSTDTPDFTENQDQVDTNTSIEPAMQGIAGTEPFIHPTGLYQIFQPNPNTSNWALDRQTTNVLNTRASTIFRGNCSVIYNYVDFGINYDTLADVSENVLTSTYDAAEWALYEYEEMDRTIGDTFIVTNYDLERKEDASGVENNCPKDYRGRQISWLDNGLLYAVRLVVRDEDRSALDNLQDIILPTFVIYPNVTSLFINNPGTLNVWRSHPDPNSPIEQRWLDEGSFIVLPPDWRTDSSSAAFQAYDGFGTMDGYRVTVRSYPEITLETLEDIQEWLSSQRLRIEFINDEIAENQQFGTGYLISYTFENADGDIFSAVASVLNDENGTLHVAELTVNQRGIDLLVETENDDAIARAQNIIRSFTITAPDDYVYLP